MPVFVVICAEGGILSEIYFVYIGVLLMFYFIIILLGLLSKLTAYFG